MLEGYETMKNYNKEKVKKHLQKMLHNKSSYDLKVTTNILTYFWPKQNQIPKLLMSSADSLATSVG